MSRTNHPRIAGTHRAGRIESLNCDGCGYCDPKPLLTAREAIAEGLADMAVTSSCLEAYGHECSEFEDYGMTHEERIDLLTRLLTNRDGSSAWGEEQMTLWEYDVMGYEARTGVSYGEYLTEHERREHMPTIRWSSDIVDLEEQAWAQLDEEQRAEAEAEREARETLEHEENAESAWLPTVAYYDPTGGREDAFDVFGGDGFIVEGPSYSPDPAGRKRDRDEWTVTSLARAWDVPTSIMLAYLNEEDLGNEACKASSRVPMHLIVDRMERQVFHPELGYKHTRLDLFTKFLLGHDEAPNSVKLGYGSRSVHPTQSQPTAAQMARRAERNLDRWQEVERLRAKARRTEDFTVRLESLRAGEALLAKLRGPSVSASKTTTRRPNFHPAPRPGNNPFKTKEVAR